MSSSHSKTHEPNALSNGFVRLTMVICLALLAALLWNTCGNTLPHDEHKAAAGEKEHHQKQP